MPQAKHLLRFIGLLVFSAIGANAGAQTIDTRSSTLEPWHCCESVDGQAFTALGSSILTASLWEGSYYGVTTLFRGVLQGWNGAPDADWQSGLSVVGPVLWQSEIRSVSGKGPVRLDFDLGGTSVTVGASYVFFVQAIEGQGIVGEFLGYGPSSNTYTGGNAVYGTASDGNTPTAETTYDAAFVATFGESSSVAPEPASVILLATGLIGLGSWGSRRRYRSKT